MKKLNIVIEDSNDALNPAELAEFLYLFRGVSVALSKIVPQRYHHVSDPPSRVLETARLRLASLTPKEINSLFNPGTAPDVLKIETISRNSPLELTVIGCALALTGAVVISGGNIEVGLTRVKASVRPLGQGIKALREALGMTKKLKLGFGLQEVKVKLSRPEYKELMQPIVGKGGFQDLFTSLQARVKKNTRELVLTQEDLDRIYRLKADPEAGGWQKRLQKIFGKHLRGEHAGRPATDRERDVIQAEITSRQVKPKRKRTKLLTEGTSST